MPAKKKQKKITKTKAKLPVKIKKPSRIETAESAATVPSSVALLRTTAGILKRNWKQLGKLVLVYAVLHYIFVNGLSALDIQSIRESLSNSFGDAGQDVVSSLILTGGVVGLSSGIDEVSGVYNSILIILNALALVWLLRHIWNGKRTSVKQAYYEGMMPAVPVVLVAAFGLLQLLPLLIGSFIAGTVFANNIAINMPEKILTIGVFLVGLVISIYFLTGTIMALFIATNPGVWPWQALKSARQLLKHRRMLVAQRLLFFAILALVFSFGILLACVAVSAQLAIVVAFILTVLALPIGVTYLYVLYRRLLE